MAAATLLTLLSTTRSELADVAAQVDPGLAARAAELRDEEFEAVASNVRERYFALWQPTLSVAIAPEDVLVRRAALRFGDAFRPGQADVPPTELPDEPWVPVLQLTRAQLLRGLQLAQRRGRSAVAALPAAELARLAPGARRYVDPMVWPRALVLALAKVVGAEPPALPRPLGTTRLERILHTIADGAVWGWDEHGEFFSPSIHRLAGAPPDTDALSVWNDLIHPDDYPAFMRATWEEETEIEYRILGLDGVTRCILDRTWVDRLPDGGVFVKGLAYDITQRRTAEEALRQAHDELSAMHAALRAAHEQVARLVETIDEVLWTMTVDAGDVDAATVYVSPAVERLLGAPLPAGGAAIAAWRSAVHPDDRHVADAAQRDTVAGRDSTVEYRVRTATGDVRWVLDRRRVRRLADGRLEVCGSVTDVTERRRMEEELLRHNVLPDQASLAGAATPPPISSRARHLRVVPEP